MNSHPPSGRRSKKSMQLFHKEQEFKELNAALEEKTASLINEAEHVLCGQDSLFSDLSATEVDVSNWSSRDAETPDSSYVLSNSHSNSRTSSKRTNKPKANGETQAKQRPLSGPAGVGNVTKKKNASSRPARPQSSKALTRIQNQLITPINLIDERATFADRISTLELEAADDTYTPSKFNEDVLPDAANDIGPDATIRFLKAKLRVMQEELENVAVECRDKASKIGELQNAVKEHEEKQQGLVKKNENFQSIIEKHKTAQEDVRSKNAHLETELNTVWKELDNMKREKKQTSANRNTLEVRLNRALEEVEKHKLTLQKSKESSKMTNDTDRKRFEQLQNENKRLEKQKSELMTAFKKQLKLIDILKRQKMHIEAAKMLEFSEEEFIRALEWGKS